MHRVRVKAYWSQSFFSYSHITQLGFGNCRARDIVRKPEATRRSLRLNMLASDEMWRAVEVDMSTLMNISKRL